MLKKIQHTKKPWIISWIPFWDDLVMSAIPWSLWRKVLVPHMFVVNEGPELLPVDATGAFDIHLRSLVSTLSSWFFTTSALRMDAWQYHDNLFWWFILQFEKSCQTFLNHLQANHHWSTVGCLLLTFFCGLFEDALHFRSERPQKRPNRSMASQWEGENGWLWRTSNYRIYFEIGWFLEVSIWIFAAVWDEFDESDGSQLRNRHNDNDQPHQYILWMSSDDLLQFSQKLIQIDWSIMGCNKNSREFTFHKKPRTQRMPGPNGLQIAQDAFLRSECGGSSDTSSDWIASHVCRRCFKVMPPNMCIYVYIYVSV